ncbi:MAG: universal stress protein [Deltaproteobacteria bacterium]|nr:universal stress protein [Deltaproteobacteria bacterium]
MNRHLLLTVGSGHTHQHAPRFVKYFYSGESKPKTTIFFVAPTVDMDISTSRDPGHAVSEAETLVASYKRKGQRALDRAREDLVQAGFAKETIETKIKVRSFGTVLDIVQETGAGYYDAVVLGRRGLSMFEELIEQSVSRKILEEEIDFPIWICKEPLPESKNVLLCADGSEQSLRMADHVGFMLEGVTGHDVTILHIDRGNGDKEAALSQARAEILSNGFPADRIREVVLESGQIGPTILGYAEENGFAAVAMGTTGAGKKSGIWPFVGSACLHVLKNMKHLCLWVSK